jgi:hypothetical protein
MRSGEGFLKDRIGRRGKDSFEAMPHLFPRVYWQIQGESTLANRFDVGCVSLMKDQGHNFEGGMWHRTHIAKRHWVASFKNALTRKTSSSLTLFIHTRCHVTARSSS